MQYREFGNTGRLVSAVGMGMNRFKIDDAKNSEEIERCAELIVKAANMGINFFDSATSYSSGKCEEILRLALKQIQGARYVCGKSMSYQDKTKDSVRRHIETSLQNIGIDFFDFYYMWCIKSIEQFKEIMVPGGPYEGVLTAKEQGLVKHICFSSHASPEDTVNMIKSGAFEGVLLSYSLVNFKEMDIALEIAYRENMGIAIMNPLGGGVIPQNPDMFENAVMGDDTSVSDAGLKFIYAHKEISSILCGISTEDELLADIKTLSEKDRYTEVRKDYIYKNFNVCTEFCTGCGYCSGCPKDISVSQIMTAYNQIKFKTGTSIYNRKDIELINRINVFRALEGKVIFENETNPCIKCGKCEKSCTQSLPIIKTIQEVFNWVKENGVSLTARKERLKSIIHSDYRRIGFFTAGAYSTYVMNCVKKWVGRDQFEWYLFDNNRFKWGEAFGNDMVIRNPEEIPELSLDVIVISNFIYSEDIYDDLTKRFPDANIKRLHTENDVPWSF